MKPCYLIKNAIFAFVICNAYAQRVAPGVPPQQYQHMPVQHHPQHQQAQYQQVPVQQQYHQPEIQYHQPDIHQQQVQYQQPVAHQQQVPQQHHPQVPPVQQIPVQQVQQVQHAGQGHAHGHGPQQVLNAANIQQERAHIQEHMDVPIDTSKMSEQELQFHYFKMHDSDNNNKLDGCELIKSLIHWHEQGSKETPHEDKPHVEEKLFSDEELVALIDPILQMDDTSRDGFIDYVEFIKAQQKVAAQNVKPGK